MTLRTTMLCLVVGAILNQEFCVAHKCIGGTFDIGATAYVTCYFDQDVSKKDFNVGFVSSRDSKADKKSIVLCNWDKEKAKESCHEEPGFKCTIHADQVTIRIRNFSAKFDGWYYCQVVSSDSKPAEKCSLTVGGNLTRYNTPSKPTQDEPSSGEDSQADKGAFVFLALFILAVVLIVILAVLCGRQRRTIRGLRNKQPLIEDGSAGELNAMRILQLGITGSGKSTLGNALLGRTELDVHDGKEEKVIRCVWKKIERQDGLKIEIVDTPGICDDTFDKKALDREKPRIFQLTGGLGFHVIIYILRFDQDFTRSVDAFEDIKEEFTNQMKAYMILVFSRVDYSKIHDVDKEGQTRSVFEKQRLAIQELIASPRGGPLKDLARSVKDRCFGFDSMLNEREKQEQINELIDEMKKLKEANKDRDKEKYRCYTTRRVVQIRKEFEERVRVKISEHRMTWEDAEDATKMEYQDEGRVLVSVARRLRNRLQCV